MFNHTAIQYAILFSDTFQGKRYAEMSSFVYTLTEALSDARDLKQDGHHLMGLYQIDYITNNLTQIFGSDILNEMVEEEIEAKNFFEKASEKDMDHYIATGSMDLSGG